MCVYKHLFFSLHNCIFCHILFCVYFYVYSIYIDIMIYGIAWKYVQDTREKNVYNQV